ncbi:MAG: hypothetical protein A2176_00355 [Spirochaetes bacterium RBG_13_51_14]|nr:MAG: hypothetical protein A2176_00355 [Spirochaetes bacterium RBG_13_51_14]
MKSLKAKNKSDFIDELALTLSDKRIKKAQKEAENEIIKIRLSQIRKKRGLRQEDIKSFSQSSVSKLESRHDMKISTLVEYLDNLGLSIEIKAYPKNNRRKNEEILILKA